MPKIISITSFRAGAGKTTLAAHLAALLAGRGMQVCLVDANFRAPEVHHLFKVDERKLATSLADYLSGRCVIQDTVYDLTYALGSDVAGRMYLSTLFGPSHLAPKLQAEGYSIDDFKDGMETLFDSLGLDFIVIDTYAGLDERTLPLMAIADMLTVVMLLDKQDFQGTGVIVEIARKIDIPEICLIINSVTIAFEPDKVKAEAEQAYNCPVIAVVPHDMELLDPNRSRIVALDRLDRTIPATLVSVADRLIRAETEE